MALLDVLSIEEARVAVGLDADDMLHDVELAAWVATISKRLDRSVGPVVVRTITDELQDGGRCHIYLNKWPVTSVSSVSEYNNTTETLLTVETNAVRPSNGYLLTRYRPDPTFYGRKVRRRTSGSDDTFCVGVQNVKVTYVAGRFATTATVDEDFKTAARIMLKNLWGSELPSVEEMGEFTVPTQRFPKFTIPNAVKEMLWEFWQERPGVA